ncbi:Protocadherin Fat 4-like [Oopsacas minuta]|uniref:Protocadherin Fat 4-like n=1 Tax=Oopsacas minuta TaxID=111878 RepID=A0AAV7K8Z9_9METZ|nr:Protocadherin Fat 4-like [Oopsacas minuta]
MFKVKTVSPNSFEILSAIDLDRETSGISIDNSVGSAKWILKVIAYDNAIIISERLTSTAEILITLEDVNDNTPLFSSNSYSAQISESSIIGTLVITLIAVDLDFGPNAEVFYIFAVDSLNTACFDIDNTTGEVRTSCVLSREDSDTLVLKVEATDGSNVDSVRLPF